MTDSAPFDGTLELISPPRFTLTTATDDPDVVVRVARAAVPPQTVAADPHAECKHNLDMNAQVWADELAAIRLERDEAVKAWTAYRDEIHLLREQRDEDAREIEHARDMAAARHAETMEARAERDEARREWSAANERFHRQRQLHGKWRRKAAKHKKRAKAWKRAANLWKAQAGDSRV